MSTIPKAFLFLRVFMFAAAVPYIMRLKLSRVAAILERGSELRSCDPDQIQKIAAYVDTSIQRGRPLVRAGCLTLGLTRYYFFRRAGMDLSLHFGMGQIGTEREFVGHCWLSKQGEPYLEREDPRPLYIEMYCISPANSRNSIGTAAVGLGRMV
jgi:hypothetical protein